MKIVLAQFNPTIGDLKGNLAKISDCLSTQQGHADLVIFPELFLCGYPPKDLLERNGFLENMEKAVEELKRLSTQCPQSVLIVGAPLIQKGSGENGLLNAALVVQNGEFLGYQAKTLLPSYDVFDETRYFDSAETNEVFQVKGKTFGITICEDMWGSHAFWPKRAYKKNPMKVLKEKGVDFLINISASPYWRNKEKDRYALIREHVRQLQLPFFHVNQVGANDDLIFDGTSMVLDAKGNLLAQAASFQEDLMCLELDDDLTAKSISFTEMDEMEALYKALLLGLKDYVRKCGFRQVVLGLSGGIDSAVTCVIAQHALGSENVTAITMPSEYSSKGSVFDSQTLAQNLGVTLLNVPIQPVFQAYRGMLEGLLPEGFNGIAEENVQARIRGNYLMAFSNQTGALLLTTGNKSELAVGYCTLYGDMSGGLNLLSDLPKTVVYQLANYINKLNPTIPDAIITKAPSAELKLNQRDQDTLPEYEVLDLILRAYVEEGKSVEELKQMGIEEGIIDWVVQKVKLNEYKRYQAAPGLKVTRKAFGAGRRMPIAARYED